MPTSQAGGSAEHPGLLFYLSVAFLAGSVIALQIAVMRIFAAGSWAHFGSMVVSLAMMGFGLTSVVMCLAKPWFARHWAGVAGWSLLLLGPLMVACNLLAQQIPFNAIFLVSDPAQVWRLAGNLALYLVPFVAGAFFLGAVFLKMSTVFGRVYFADLVGAGFGGLLVLGGMYLAAPADMILVPLFLWVLAGLAWFAFRASRIGLAAVVGAGLLSAAGHIFLPSALGITTLAVSDYKGVAYARKFPDAQKVHDSTSPFGQLEIYSSSYLHFAPGLSDNAAFNLPQMPPNAYLGMYIDGEGPFGIMRKLTEAETAYFRFLPMFYPYVIKDKPNTFVVQFGGGISTTVALHQSAKVTVAEGNPAIVDVFRTDETVRKVTGDILRNPALRLVEREGRLFLATSHETFDVIDLSLADSAGLSNPGGFAIVEKYAYSQEAFETYMRALAPGGILSVTLWNKEEPPKSVLKLYATMAAAARAAGSSDIGQSFYAVSTYLSTTTVLYKRGAFRPEELAKLRAHSKAMSFDEVTAPDFAYDASRTDKTLDAYRESIFGAGKPSQPGGAPVGSEVDPTAPADPIDGSDTSAEPAPTQLPAITMAQLTWHSLIHGGFDDMARRYVFDTRPLTNDRPYFAAYVKPKDLPHVTDRLELFQDEWGYLLLWATLGMAAAAAAVLVLIPLALDLPTLFSRYPGRLGTIVYFGCLGLGYIMVEVTLIAKFVLPLANPTISASILITGMLFFSGLGSLVSDRILGSHRRVMPVVFCAIAALLIAYGLFLDPVLDAIGEFDYGARLCACLLLTAPPAFLMGMPMPTAMASLGRLGKEHMFLWAWGINGCASVIGAAAVPLIATSFGLASVLMLAGAAYLIALPSFFSVLRPLR